MKHDQVLLLIADIHEIESELSNKYGTTITLTFDVKKCSLRTLMAATNMAFSKYSGVKKIIDLRVTCSFKDHTLFRQIFMYIAADLGYTREDIGDFMSKEHSTVTHAVQKIKLRIKKNSDLVIKQIEIIKQSI